MMNEMPPKYATLCISLFGFLLSVPQPFAWAQFAESERRMFARCAGAQRSECLAAGYQRSLAALRDSRHFQLSRDIALAPPPSEKTLLSPVRPAEVVARAWDYGRPYRMPPQQSGEKPHGVDDRRQEAAAPFEVKVLSRARFVGISPGTGSLAWAPKRWSNVTALPPGLGIASPSIVQQERILSRTHHLSGTSMQANQSHSQLEIPSNGSSQVSGAAPLAEAERARWAKAKPLQRETTKGAEPERAKVPLAAIINNSSAQVAWPLAEAERARWVQVRRLQHSNNTPSELLTATNRTVSSASGQSLNSTSRAGVKPLLSAGRRLVLAEEVGNELKIDEAELLGPNATNVTREWLHNLRKVKLLKDSKGGRRPKKPVKSVDMMPPLVGTNWTLPKILFGVDSPYQVSHEFVRKFIPIGAGTNPKILSPTFFNDLPEDANASSSHHGFNWTFSDNPLVFVKDKDVHILSPALLSLYNRSDSIVNLPEIFPNNAEMYAFLKESFETFIVPEIKRAFEEHREIFEGFERPPPASPTSEPNVDYDFDAEEEKTSTANSVFNRRPTWLRFVPERLTPDELALRRNYHDKVWTKDARERSEWRQWYREHRNLSDDELDTLMQLNASKPFDFMLSDVGDPITLSPYILDPKNASSPSVLNPLTFSPYIVSPYIFGPFIVSPMTGTPQIVSPSILAFSVLAPYTLAPLIVAPQAFNPNILGPDVLSPFILSPSILSPLIGTPVVLSPCILSPGAASPTILSPGALSPSILCPGILSPTDNLSPCANCPVY